MLRGPLRRDLPGVEARGSERDGNMRTPTRGSFDPNLDDAMLAQQSNPGAVADRGVRERVVRDRDAVRVRDPERECVLVRVDARDGWCHHDDLLLDC